MTDETVRDEFVLHALNISHQWRLAGRWQDALTVLRGAAPVADELNDTRRAQVWLHIARTLNDMATFGGVENAEEHAAALNRALEYAEASGDASLIGVAWDSKGMAEHARFLNNGRFKEPEYEMEFFERGLKVREQVGEPRGLAESFFHLGLVHQVVRGDSVTGEPYFAQSYDLAKQANDKVMQSYAIRHLAYGRADKGEMPAALDGFRESLQLREEAGFTPGVAMALFVLGEVEGEHGDKEQARQYLERAKDILGGLGATKRVAWVEAALDKLNGG